MATITIGVSDNIQAKVNAAQSGDVLLLTDGTYNQQVNFTGKSGITLQAANLVAVTVNPSGPVASGGKVVINASSFGAALFGGANITVKGIIIDGCSNAVQHPAIVIGNGWNLQDCIAQNCNSCGFGGEFNNVSFLRCYAQHNGYMGFGCGSANGQTRLANVTVTNCGTFRNNRGWPTNVFGGYGVQRPQGWVVDPNFEAGGGKWCFLNGAVFDGYWAEGNGGPGIWFDGPNANIVVKNAKLLNNVVAVNPWDGQGFCNEICEGPIAYQHCLLQGNTGQSAIAEAHGVSVTDCDIVDGIYYRNLSMAGTSNGYRNNGVQNSTVTGNRLYGSASVNAGGFPAGWMTTYHIVTAPNTSGLNVSTLHWAPLGQSSSSTPASSSSQVASVPGTIVPPAAKIVDANGDTWTLVSGQIAKNGQTDPVTNGVLILAYYASKVYQKAGAGWYVWTGTQWDSTADPTPVSSSSVSSSSSVTPSSSSSSSSTPPVAPRTVVSVVVTFSDGTTQTLH